VITSLTCVSSETVTSKTNKTNRNY
jgi:hypothetical protein